MQGIASSATTSKYPIDAGLLHKARQLKQSSLFVNPSDGAELLEKQLIFLVLAGCKPVAEVASGHWIDVPGGRRTVADDPGLVGEFLHSLGLFYHLSDFGGRATGATVAVTSETLEQYTRAMGSSNVGKLFGYPDTAVRAFQTGESALLPTGQQELREQEAGLPDTLTMFRLSLDHWAEELEVIEEWYSVLQTAGLVEE